MIRFAQVDGTIIEASITKAEFALDPISDRYGSLIINDGGKQVGYLNLRTFIVSDAANQLRDAFQLFNANGVTPRAGEILLCGSHMPLYPMDKPGKLTMTVEGVGEISYQMS